MASAVDLATLLAALALPVVVVVRFGLRGIIPAAIIHWVILVAAGKALSTLDPDRDAGLVDGIWLLFGWIMGLAYALAVFPIDRLIRFVIRRAASRRRTVPR